MPNQLPWEECHQRAYELLRSKLRSAHVLRIPKNGEPFALHTDASRVAVGATLGQLDQDGLEHPLAFAFISLRDRSVPGRPLSARPMRLFGHWISSGTLCMGPRSLWSVTTTHSNTSGTVLRKVPSCCAGCWLSKCLTWRSTTSGVQIML